MLYYVSKHVLIGPVLRQTVQLSVHGAQHIPESGPVVIASNHLSEIDSLILPLVVSRRLTFLAKAEYFRSPGLRGHAVRAFLRGTGQIPVDRTGDEAALDAATSLLEHGGAWGIYPEGTRSPDGRLHRGHTGMARAAARVPGTMVVPTFIQGTRHINPPGTRRLLRGSVSVTFGRALSIEDLMKGDATVRTATNEVMGAIAGLGNVEYIDTYSHTFR